jgi:hypothetical protein
MDPGDHIFKHTKPLIIYIQDPNISTFPAVFIVMHSGIRNIQDIWSFWGGLFGERRKHDLSKLMGMPAIGNGIPVGMHHALNGPTEQKWYPNSW